MHNRREEEHFALDGICVQFRDPFYLKAGGLYLKKKFLESLFVKATHQIQLSFPPLSLAENSGLVNVYNVL